MMDRETKAMIIAAIMAIIIVVGVVFGGVVGVAWLGAGIRLGQTYQTSGHVRLYEHSSWIQPHTHVVLETYGGTEASFTLLGYHEFDIGSAYEIKTICRRGGLWDMANWFEVVEITLLIKR